MPAPDKAIEIKALFVALIAFLTALWGWVGWTILIWIACMLTDYISGTLAAKKSGEWSSDIAREGLWHKLGEVFAVLVAAMCDIALKILIQGAGVKIGIEIGPLITPVVLLWYIITELGSIAENAGKLGAPVPEWLKKTLAQYKDKIDAGEKPPDSEPEEYVGKHER